MDNTQQPNSSADDINDELAVRRAKLAKLRLSGDPFPNTFVRTDLAGKLHELYDSHDKEQLKQQAIQVTVAGRMMTRRLMGKASFVTLQDVSGLLQIYVACDQIPETFYYEEFKGWDLGDIIGVSGTLFRTKKGELTVECHALQLLTKALRPLPDKYHGLVDQESRYRQRYLDLISNSQSRQVFVVRSQIIAAIRQFLIMRNFMEVETPMMQSLPGGAAARPFVTHHNALNIDLYLRVAPELYLKRLVVGGFERVFELNRNFRNEGVSTKHNPEFTLLEFYMAYANYRDLMPFTQELLRFVAHSVLKSTQICYAGTVIDLQKPFACMSMLQAICHYNPEITEHDLQDLQQVRNLANARQIPWNIQWGVGKLQSQIFDMTVEQHLLQPTFITDYPTEISPLARRKFNDPQFTERFELFMAGAEVANGFSELNDPQDQAKRFCDQAEQRASGDQEAMFYDDDYITALQHGLPPTAGEGIGIDRLVMLFTDSHTIRDVILFPTLRPSPRSS